jgi:putative ABC transport system permease protein
MFLRLIADNFARRPRRKLLTAAALALGMAVATAALSVSLDVGDRLAQEFRSLGANLIVTPEADSLPLEIGGVDYRPVNAGAYLPEADLPKIKTVFWHNNIIAFAPILEERADLFIQVTGVEAEKKRDYVELSQTSNQPVPIIGTWVGHSVPLSDGSVFATGVDKTNPWWSVSGRWFHEAADECVVGAQLAQRLGLKLGDSVHLGGSGPRVQLRSSLPSFLVTGILSTGGSEDHVVMLPLKIVQELSERPGQYRKLYVSALTKPEDDFARRDPKTMNAKDLERWSCSPYVSSIAYSIRQVLPGSDVRVIHRVADGEGKILTRVRMLLWLVTFASLLAAALAVGASSAASVIERRTEIGLMKALGAGSGTVGWLLAAEQLLLAFVGGCVGYAVGLLLARFLGTKIFGVPPEPSLLVLGVILVLAAGVTLLGSALPLRRAARFDPAPILRGE